MVNGYVPPTKIIKTEDGKFAVVEDTEEERVRGVFETLDKAVEAKRQMDHRLY